MHLAHAEGVLGIALGGAPSKRTLDIPAQRGHAAVHDDLGLGGLEPRVVRECITHCLRDLAIGSIRNVEHPALLVARSPVDENAIVVDRVGPPLPRRRRSP